MSDKIQELENKLAFAATQEEKVDALNALATELAIIDYQQALAKSDEAAKLARAANYRPGLAQSLTQLCRANTQLGHYDVALTQATEAQSIFQKLEDSKGIAHINLAASEIYQSLGDYATALEHATHACNLALTSGDAESESSALIYMAIAHGQADDHEQALVHFQKSLDIIRDNGYKQREAVVLNNMAMARQGMGEYQDALSLALESLNLGRELGHNTFEPTVLDTISLIYVGLEEPERALEYARECLRLSREFSLPQQQVWSLLSIGKIQYRQQDDQALDYLRQAQTLAQKINAKRELSESHKLLAEWYKDQDRFEDAFIHHQQFHALNEEMFNAESAKRLQLLKVQQQIDTAQKEADILEQKNVELEKEIAERKQAEAILHQSEEKFRTLFEKSSDAYLILEDNIFTDCNQATVDMLHAASKEEVLLLHPSKLSPEWQPDGRPSAAKADEMIQMALEKGNHRFEWMHRRADGEDFPVEVMLTLIRLGGKEAVFTVWRDITARKQAQATIAKRSAELQTVAEVSAVVATTRDTSQLLQNVVDLMQSRFGFYHAHVYLLNDARDTLFMTAGAGEIGRQMVAESLTIPLHHERSLMAQAVRSAQGVIENDVRANPAFHSHSMLPETRSEMAVPMIVGDRVIGVLGVQSDEVGRFTQQDVATQTTLAAQIAVALENARSFEQAQEAVANLNEITRRLTREGWQDYLGDLPAEAVGFVYDASQLDVVLPITEVGDEKASEKIANNGSDVETLQHLTQAITVHGEAIGRLAVIPDETDEQVDPEMMEIITAVTEQLSARIENLRLTDQTQSALAETEEQARRLAQLNQMSAALNQAETLTNVYETAVAETPKVLPVDRVSLSLLNDTGEQFKVAAFYGEESDMPIGTQLPAEGSPMMMAIQENRIIEGTTDDAITMALFAPLFVGGRAIGTLNVGSKQADDAFGSRDENLLRQIAALVGSSIENMRLLENEQNRARREQLKREIAEKVRGSADVETIMRTAVAEVGRALGRRTFIYLEDQPETSEE